MNTIVIAATALDNANAADPKKHADGTSEALGYADAITRWVHRLVPAPSPALTLAARAQHLERWVIPRSAFPDGKAAYFQWRKAVQARQGDRARELLAGLVSADIIDRVATLIAKKAPADDPEAQALEDGACLVFLEQEIAEFAAQHRDYTTEQYIVILRKTWKKMSPAAHTFALGLHLDEPFAGLVKAALSLP